MSILRVENLRRHFKSLRAVDDISFEMQPGEILGLLGPNGAGKTTTMQMLLGVLTPTSGLIEVFGRNLALHRQEICERVNFSSTYTNLPWNLKVKDNLHIFSNLYSIPDRKQRIAEVIEIFRLGEILNHTVIALSAGQQTRLNLAKAFINKPELVFLDEPTASLDPENAVVIRDWIKLQREQAGVSVLFTSHNMSEVESVCDRVIFINQGKIVANGTPGELARSLDQSRLSLVVEESACQKFRAFCEEKGLKLDIEEARYTISLPEAELSGLLQEITRREIPFYALEVSKPSLEDYFIEQTLKGRAATTAFNNKVQS